MLLITGASGQLGQCLQDVFPPQELLLTDVAELDITHWPAVEEFGKKHTVSAIINCAAYTNVDKAEDEPELAHKINASGAENLARLSALLQVPLVHVSTDYVFDGSANTPRTEKDDVRPLGVYGKTKNDGEQAVLKYAHTAVILRTAWLYSQYGKNFVKTMLTLGKQKESLGVVCDQVGSPTYAVHLAQAIKDILPQIKPQTHEIYHFTNEGICSWYDLTWYALNHAGSACQVRPIRSAEYPTKAKRPAYSVLDKTKLKNTFNLSVPHWTKGVEECLEKLS